jgi:phenylalanyl-tRNA synthetase beta chain
LLEVVEKNHRSRDRIALFEIGPEFYPKGDDKNPVDENPKLAIALTGVRSHFSWQSADQELMDYYDLKGLMEELLADLHIKDISYSPDTAPSYHPGKCARIERNGKILGMMGEIHPIVKGNYKLAEAPLAVAVLDLDILLEEIDDLYNVQPIPDQPPVLEDLALVVDDHVPAEAVQSLIIEAGGETLAEIRLFDVYRGEQLGEGKKSLAYSLVYQHPDKTLTDKEVAAIRGSIVKRLEKELGAQLRSW